MVRRIMQISKLPERVHRGGNVAGGGASCGSLAEVRMQ